MKHQLEDKLEVEMPPMQRTVTRTYRVHIAWTNEQDEQRDDQISN